MCLTVYFFRLCAPFGVVRPTLVVLNQLQLRMTLQELLDLLAVFGGVKSTGSVDQAALGSQ